jgi:hypothetical protein
MGGKLLDVLNPGVSIVSNDGGREYFQRSSSAFMASHSMTPKGEESTDKHRLINFPRRKVIEFAKFMSSVGSGGAF